MSRTPHCPHCRKALALARAYGHKPACPLTAIPERARRLIQAERRGYMRGPARIACVRARAAELEQRAARLGMTALVIELQQLRARCDALVAACEAARAEERARFLRRWHEVMGGLHVAP